MSTSLDIALAYLRRGWSVIPVPYGQKKPVIDEWQKLRITEETAGQYFNGKPINLGVLLGEPSEWLVDVDLDHLRAVELAPNFLPSTPLVFGRESKPRSHWLFRVSAPLKTKKINSKAHGMIVELRSTGLQTILPPSMHVGGERIVWDDEQAEPALIDPEVLLEAVVRLGEHVKNELGEPVLPRKSKAKRSAPAPVTPTDEEVPPWVDGPKLPDTEQRVKRCLAAMHRIQTIDQNDGSSRLYTVACRIVEHDLDDAVAITTFRQYERSKPFPKHWSDDDVLTRVRDAEKACERGAAFVARLDETGFIALGTRDPDTGRLVLSPKRTLPTAEAFVEEFHQHTDGRTIHNFGGQLWTWQGNRYVEFEEGAIKQRLMPWLHGALRYQYSPKTGESSLVNFEANPGSVNVALESVRNHTHLPSSTQQPSWLGWQAGRPEPQDLLPCRSGIFHLPTRQLFAPSPAFFCTYALDYDPNPRAPQPTQWLRFLHEVLGDDVEAWDLLQEWFGYSLTADTSQQKMLLIVGPKRSGKGTIARVLAALIGIANVCGPTTSSLAGQFGLQPLIGKTLAIVSDARFRGESVPTVVERLLCISGEDAVTIDRKYLESVTMKLLTRFVFLSNELPQLSDASAALIGRFLILRLTNSFYGREDRQLTKRLITELPGIFNWALEGRERLHQRGHFVMPTSVADTVGELEDLASPVGAFVRELCDVGPGYRATTEELFATWSSWCLRSGAKPGTIQRFGRDLGAAIAGVRCRKGDSARFYDGIRLKGSQQ